MERNSTSNEIFFGRNLKTLIRQSGKTNRQIAQELGYQPTTLSNWVTGASYPSVDRMIEIAKYFDVSIGALLTKNILKHGVSTVSESTAQYSPHDLFTKRQLATIRKICEEEIQRLSVLKSNLESELATLIAGAESKDREIDRLKKRIKELESK